MAGIDTYTKLILHCDGADASTTFTDSSTAQAAKTQTAAGNSQIDTAQSKFGGASGLFDGTGDYVTSPDSADWDFGTADFTVDMWVRFAAITATHDLVARVVNTAGTINFKLKMSATALAIVFGGATPKSEAWSPVIDTWYHIAVTRSGTDLQFWVDGTQLGTATTNSTDISYSETLSIGGDFENNIEYLNGWIDELRISKGIARWTGDFTPPTAAYSATEIKTINSLAIASVKAVKGLAIASMKTRNGLA